MCLGCAPNISLKEKTIMATGATIRNLRFGMSILKYIWRIKNGIWILTTDVKAVRIQSNCASY